MEKYKLREDYIAYEEDSRVNKGSFKSDTINKPKEPLLSSEQFLRTLTKKYSLGQWMEAYAKYHTEWHLNNVKEVVCEEANVSMMKKSNYGKSRKWQNCKEEEVDLFQYEVKTSVDKKSITNAVEKYINENLKK